MKRLVLRRGVIRRYPYHPVLQHSASLRKCFFSGDNVSKSSVEDSASTEDFRNKLLRAPFQRVGTPGPLFPWRHSEQVLPRLIPGSQEFKEKGCLLGGNVVSSNPMFDTYVTAFLFLEVPLYKMMFFKHWQADMAESMSWAFSQAMSAILSHVYQVPLDKISRGESGLDFDNFRGSIGRTDNKSNDNDQEGLIHEQVTEMVENRLWYLFESARENGKDQIQVRLQCQPTGQVQMVNLCVFPFLSRASLKRDPHLKSKYLRMLNLMVDAPQEALQIYHELVGEFSSRGVVESTVICQVLVACDEIFWVKDSATGAIIQGHEDGQIRKVWHLVRMEMVIETRPTDKKLIIPIEHKQGNWQLTDIDDLLEGNLMI